YGAGCYQSVAVVVVKEEDAPSECAGRRVYGFQYYSQSHNRGNRLEDMQKILLERYQRQVLNTIDDIIGWDPRLALSGMI
nr:hypothetical protein [Tanacetum cinerariifolium]